MTQHDLTVHEETQGRCKHRPLWPGFTDTSLQIRSRTFLIVVKCPPYILGLSVYKAVLVMSSNDKTSSGT
ncbi:hypothetical protein SKAU_G00170810 [Synaphobranchus kaupii]|uniref:Uncharacterized protein n=1 Tax=Synaphobranchus kaupii TaxID=118154 RepID=A0A9Q1IZS6_SYNKA|nr:hypothetical protein SKAU_G00170810 [Synaphobranchus kaupii]